MSQEAPPCRDPLSVAKRVLYRVANEYAKSDDPFDGYVRDALRRVADEIADEQRRESTDTP